MRAREPGPRAPFLDPPVSYDHSKNVSTGRRLILAAKWGTVFKQMYLQESFAVLKWEALCVFTSHFDEFLSSTEMDCDCAVFLCLTLKDSDWESKRLQRVRMHCSV